MTWCVGGFQDSRPGLDCQFWKSCAMTLTSTPSLLQRKSKPFHCIERMHIILRTTLKGVSFALRCELSTRTLRVTASDIESCNLCSKTAGHIIQTHNLWHQSRLNLQYVIYIYLQDLFTTLELAFRVNIERSPSWDVIGMWAGTSCHIRGKWHLRREEAAESLNCWYHFMPVAEKWARQLHADWTCSISSDFNECWFSAMDFISGS